MTVLQFLLALGLALLLNQPLRFRGWPGRWRSCRGRCRRWSSASCGGWSTTRTPGCSTRCCTGVGADGLRHNWLGDFGTALPAVIVVGVWAGMPQTTVMLLAGLQGVPRELHEAAAVDGAGAWRRFRTVTCPR